MWNYNEPLDNCRCGCPLYSGRPKGEEYHCAWIYSAPGVRLKKQRQKAHRSWHYTWWTFFLRDKMATGLCTKWEGREQLDPDIIEGIRCKWMWNRAVCRFLDENIKPYQCCIYITLISISVHINYRYPLDSKDTSTDRWKKVLEAMNNKCRNVRNSKKPPQKPSEA